MTDIPVPVISCWQPWATLIAKGLKGIETRSWTLPAGVSWVAIHATQRTPGPAMRAAWATPQIRDPLARLGITDMNWTSRPGSLPCLSIVALAKFRGPVRTEDLLTLWAHRTREHFRQVDDAERARGNYGPGRYGWPIDDVIDLNDYPVGNIVGKQRLWYLDPTNTQRLLQALIKARLMVPSPWRGSTTTPPVIPFGTA